MAATQIDYFEILWKGHGQELSYQQVLFINLTVLSQRNFNLDVHICLCKIKKRLNQVQYVAVRVGTVDNRYLLNNKPSTLVQFIS